MADFVQKTVNKTAVRDLSVPIASVEQFDSIVEMVFDDNPFGCVEYTTRDGQTIAGVVRNREHYTAKVNFLNDAGKRSGPSDQSPTSRPSGERRQVPGTRPSRPRWEQRQPRTAAAQVPRPSGETTSSPSPERASDPSYQDDAIRDRVESGPTLRLPGWLFPRAGQNLVSGISITSSNAYPIRNGYRHRIDGECARIIGILREEGLPGRTYHVGSIGIFGRSARRALTAQSEFSEVQNL